MVVKGEGAIEWFLDVIEEILSYRFDSGNFIPTFLLVQK